MKVEGGCACGAVRFASTAPPLVTRVCWCRVCQYLGGGNGTVNATFHSESFTVTGRTASHRFVADSGNVMHREFCPQCGTPLFTRAEIRPQLRGVRVGTLDDPELAKPEMTIWTAAAPAWACFDPALPQAAGQPPPPKV